MVTIEDSWFSSNKVSGWGLVEILSWQGEHDPLIQNNDGIVSQTNTDLCPFVALSDTIPEIPQNVRCVQVGGGEFIPDITPVASPVSLSPVGPSVQYTCYSSTRDVMDFLSVLPANFPMTIELCPSTVYNIGRQDSDGSWIDGDPPLFARSSTIYKCGSKGLSSGQCILRYGEKQFWSESGSDPVALVEVHGITFENASEVSILLDNTGDITFVDCII